MTDTRHQVVVTGIGALSPNGNGAEAFWQATKRGVSGVGRISRFDPSKGMLCRYTLRVNYIVRELILVLCINPRTFPAVPSARSGVAVSEWLRG